MRWWFIAVFGLCSGAFADAGNGTGVYVGAQGSKLWWNTGNGTYSDYMWGASVGFDYVRPWGFYGGGRLFWIFGDPKDGDTSRKLENFNIHGRFGYTFGKRMTWTAYTGVGFSSLYNKKKEKSASCRQLTYDSVYTMVGLMTIYHFSPYTSFGFDYAWMPDVDPWLRIGSYKDLRFDLKRKATQTIELPLQFTFPRMKVRWLQYRLIPFFRYTTIGSLRVPTGASCVSGDQQRIKEGGLRFELSFF